MPAQKEPETSGILYTPVRSFSCIFPALYSVLLEIFAATFIDVIAWLHFGQYPTLLACEVRYTDHNYREIWCPFLQELLNTWKRDSYLQFCVPVLVFGGALIV